MTFFPPLPAVWDGCAHFAPSAVASALDALLLRKLEATTTHLIATSHNAGRPLTHCSRARSERAGEQAERARRLPDRAAPLGYHGGRPWPCNGRAPREDPVFARWKAAVMSAALVAGAFTAVTAVTAVSATVASAGAASAGPCAARSSLLRELGLWSARGRCGVLQCHRAHFPHPVLAP